MGLMSIVVSPSNSLRVDPVVLGMSPDESDIHHAVGVVDPNHDPIFVAGDVEHGASILEDTGRCDIAFQFGRRSPVCFESMSVPCEDGFLGIPIRRILLPERLQRAQRDHSHGQHDSPNMGLLQGVRIMRPAGANPEAGIGEDHDPETHLIPNVLKSVLQPSTHPLKIFGNDYDTPDGTCIRDYIHVTDLCDAHMKALDYLLQGGRTETLNLGNGKGFSVLDVVNAAQRITGQKINYSVVARRPGDPAVLVASAGKAKETLGWTPTYTDLSKIIETAWRWHRKQHA